MHYTQRRLPDKPHLVKVAGRWLCHDNYYMMATEDTPALAYCAWKLKESRRSRIPRKGVWNLPACRQWYNQGCWAMRYYFGKRQIIGYDPSTDELILRG